MPQKIYAVLRNALLFFFLVTLVDGIKLAGGPVITKIVWGIVFGVMMVSVPFFLNFFKISVNVGAKILLSLVFSFAFFFLIYTNVAGIGSVNASVIDLGISGTIIRLDALSTLIFAAIVAALTSVGLDSLSKAR